MCRTIVCSDVFTGLLISLWTIVQTSFHIVWAISGYNFYFCNIKPTNCWVAIVYLTYFYNRECGDINIVHERGLFATSPWQLYISNDYFRSNQTVDEELYEIVEAILNNAQLPEQSHSASRTISYILILIITDSLWMMSAFLLFAGTCFQVKNWLSLLFYGPWLILATFVSLIDVIAAVHFGLDILEIHNYTSWLRFIGVGNYKDFSHFNEYESSRFIPVGPAITLSLLLSRFMIFWVINVINIFQVMAVAELAYQDNLDEDRRRQRSRNHRRRTNIEKEENLKSAETRIKNWQLFYGSSETASKASTASLESSENVCMSNFPNASNSKEHNTSSLTTMREYGIST